MAKTKQPKPKQPRGSKNFFDDQLEELHQLYPEFMAQPQDHRNPIMTAWKAKTAKDFMAKHGARKKRPEETDEAYYGVSLIPRSSSLAANLI